VLQIYYSINNGALQKIDEDLAEKLRSINFLQKYNLNFLERLPAMKIQFI